MKGAFAHHTICNDTKRAMDRFASGDLYRNFEESFARRFGEGRDFTEEDKALLKKFWINRAKSFYSSQIPAENTKLIAIGTGLAKIAAPVAHDAAFMEEAREEWRQQRMQAIDNSNVRPL